MQRSGELARETREIFAARGLAVDARAVPVPERELLDFAGAVATSDTHLIDAQKVLVDLAGEIIHGSCQTASTHFPVTLKNTEDAIILLRQLPTANCSKLEPKTRNSNKTLVKTQRFSI